MPVSKGDIYAAFDTKNQCVFTELNISIIKNSLVAKVHKLTSTVAAKCRWKIPIPVRLKKLSISYTYAINNI